MERAAEMRAKEWVHRQWCALYPDMIRGILKYMSFEDYYNRMTGGTIDRRPKEEILEEAERIRKEMGIN